MIGERAWKRDGAANNAWYPWRYGGYQATGQTQYGEVHGTHSFCREPASAVRLQVYDSDTDGDDLMGTLNFGGSADLSAGIDLGDARIKAVYTVY